MMVPSGRLVCVAACLLAQSAAAQTGSIRGTVIHPNGSTVRDAPVRVTSDETEADFRQRSGADGLYEISNVPAGTYAVSVAMPCCAFEPYVRADVEIDAGSTVELDVQLVEGESLNVLADDPFTLNTEMRERQELSDGPVPRTPDGRPDLSGVWLTSEDPYPNPPEALPWAQALQEERAASSFRDHPHTRCLPSEPAFPGATAFMVKFVQTPELIVTLFEDVPGFRQIFMDGRELPEHPNPTWMGHSVGRWEGDTLVIDSVGFNDRGWIGGGYPRTMQMRMKERYTRTEYGKLEVQVMIEDPGVYTEPFVRNATWDYAPQEELLEFVCENNKWATEDSP